MRDSATRSANASRPTPNRVGLLAVTIIGPESTGKTTLARRLAERFGAEWSGEAARAYVDARHARGDVTSLGPEDVAPIACAQTTLEDAAAMRVAASGVGLVVRDTDLVSTVVYARYYYGACPAWVEGAARARRAALYLLCDVDAPWAPDAVRDGGASEPAERARLRDAFAAALAEFGCRTVWVRGGWAERECAAVDAVCALRTAVRTAAAP